MLAFLLMADNDEVLYGVSGEKKVSKAAGSPSVRVICCKGFN